MGGGRGPFIMQGRSHKTKRSGGEGGGVLDRRDVPDLMHGRKEFPTKLVRAVAENVRYYRCCWREDSMFVAAAGKTWPWIVAQQKTKWRAKTKSVNRTLGGANTTPLWYIQCDMVKNNLDNAIVRGGKITSLLLLLVPVCHTPPSPPPAPPVKTPPTPPLSPLKPTPARQHEDNQHRGGSTVSPDTRVQTRGPLQPHRIAGKGRYTSYRTRPAKTHPIWKKKIKKYS